MWHSFVYITYFLITIIDVNLGFKLFIRNYMTGAAFHTKKKNAEYFWMPVSLIFCWRCTVCSVLSCLLYSVVFIVVCIPLPFSIWFFFRFPTFFLFFLQTDSFKRLFVIIYLLIIHKQLQRHKYNLNAFALLEQKLT